MVTLAAVHGKVESIDARLNIVVEVTETARQENRTEHAEFRVILGDIKEEFHRLNGTVANLVDRTDTLEGDVRPLHVERAARLAVHGFLTTVKGRIIAGLAISGGVLTITSAVVMLAQTILRDWP